MSFYKKAINNCIQEEWTKDWEENPTCKMTKIFYPKPDRAKAKQLLNLSNRDDRLDVIRGDLRLGDLQGRVNKLPGRPPDRIFGRAVNRPYPDGSSGPKVFLTFSKETVCGLGRGPHCLEGPDSAAEFVQGRHLALNYLCLSF